MLYKQEEVAVERAKAHPKEAAAGTLKYDVLSPRPGNDGSGKYMTSKPPEGTEKRFSPSQVRAEKVEGWKVDGWGETKQAVGDERRPRRNTPSTVEKARSKSYTDF
mgnify:CR=1 FL=1